MFSSSSCEVKRVKMPKYNEDSSADVDDLLEAPFKEKRTKQAGRHSKESRSPSRRKSGDSSYDWSPSSGNSTESPLESDKRGRKKDKSRRRGDRSEKRRRSHSRSRSHHHRESDDQKRHRQHHSRSHDRREQLEDGRRGYSPKRRPPVVPKKVYPRVEEMTIEERDARTVFVMQLNPRCPEREIRDFFEQCGDIRDVRLICDQRTKRSKGIAYIEFYEVDSVDKALTLNGTRLKGAPIIIQVTQSEKNLLYGGYGDRSNAPLQGPMKLYVGNLHFNIDEEMIRSIFEPFGEIERIEMLKDSQGGRSRGYCFITYCTGENAKKAMEQLNGFELAGREIKVNYVTEHAGTTGSNSRNLDSDDLESAGLPLGATGRLQLMAKLAEGTGMQLPAVSQQLLQQHQQQPQIVQNVQSSHVAPSISTQCFMLSNMFDPSTETEPNWDEEIRDDVLSECHRHGGVTHIFVDKTSPQGNVYCKCPTIAIAVACVNSLHGRMFACKQIAANFVPLANYHALFPDSVIPMTPKAR